jgi:hypothetical protein
MKYSPFYTLIISALILLLTSCSEHPGYREFHFALRRPNHIEIFEDKALNEEMRSLAIQAMTNRGVDYFIDTNGKLFFKRSMMEYELDLWCITDDMFSISKDSIHLRDKLKKQLDIR